MVAQAGLKPDIAIAGLELLVRLSPLPECFYNDRGVLLPSVFVGLEIESRALSRLSKHSVKGTTSPTSLTPPHTHKKKY